MAKYRSAGARAARLHQGQLIDVLEEEGEIVIRGVNPGTAQQVRADLECVPLADGRLQLRARPGSVTARSGAQVRHRPD